jgi:hypothetical protein
MKVKFWVTRASSKLRKQSYHPKRKGDATKTGRDNNPDVPEPVKNPTARIIKGFAATYSA